LTELHTAFNCPADWNAMYGDDQTRRCSLCQRTVYNISEMTRDEAIAFLEERGTKICVRYFKRRDGTILTKPCGKVKQSVYRRRLRIASALSALSVFGFTFFSPLAVAGQRAMTPKQQFKFYSRQLQLAREMLAEETGKDEKAVLQERVRSYRLRMSEAYKRLSREDINDLLNSDPKT